MATKENGSVRIHLTIDDLRKAVKDVRPYPHIKPRLYNPQWREIVMYGITGWMSSEFIDGENAVQFGGYFKRDPKDNTIVGQLIDIFGQSFIEGTLKLREKQFYFIKTYEGRPVIRPVIEYSLKREEKLWKGNYSMSMYEGGGIGKAEAMITKFHNNAFGIIMRYSNSSDRRSNMRAQV